MKGLAIKRLESLSLRELSIFFRNDGKNPAFEKINVTEVRITNDLSYMTVYYTTFLSEDKEMLKNALEHDKGYIRMAIARKISARKMPELIFKFDEALEYGNKIDSLISEIHKKKI